MPNPTQPFATPLLFLVRLLSVLLLPAFFLSGCSSQPAVPEIDAEVKVALNPDPPVIGVNTLKVSVTNSAGQPVRLRMIDVEGNMNHAGMRPVFTRLAEQAPGEYSGTIEFTMGGDWFLLLTSEPTAEGRLNKKVDVRGVKAK